VPLHLLLDALTSAVELAGSDGLKMFTVVLEHCFDEKDRQVCEAFLSDRI
jgi:hypothetical protein